MNEPLQQNQDFAKTIEESKQAIAQEAVKDVKKRAGRPRKSPETGSGTPVNQTVSSTPNIGLVGANPPPNISQFLEVPLIAISKGPANKYKIPELALSPEEAKACAESLNQVMQAFIPDINQMSPKTAAIIAAFTTFGAIGFMKYQIYLEHAPKPVEKPEPTIQEQVAQNQNTIHADNYFGKP